LEAIEKALIFYYILSPEGKIYKFNSIKGFAKRHMKVHPNTLKDIIFKRRKPTLGWRIPTEEEKSTCEIIDMRWERFKDF
jgi:hypothetical protein